MDIKKLPSEKEILTLMLVYKLEKEDATMMNVLNNYNTSYNTTLSPQTISTFLTRLKRKGYLNSIKKGRYTYYEPVISKEEFNKMYLKNATMLLFDGDIQELKRTCANM